ncbi:MAG: tetratricopeptide repeat protein [Elusimicrobiota bacterium]
MQILIDQVLTDPENPKATQFFRNLSREKVLQHYFVVRQKRANAIRQTLRMKDSLRLTDAEIDGLTEALHELEPGTESDLLAKPIKQELAKEISEVEFRALLKQATDLYRRGQVDKGTEVLAQALELRQISSEPFYALIQGMTSNKPRTSATPVTPAKTAPTAPPKTVITAQMRAQSQELFREGVRLYSKGKLAEALDTFKRSLELNPENEWARQSYERTLRELGSTGKASISKTSAKALPVAARNPAALKQAPLADKDLDAIEQLLAVRQPAVALNRLKPLLASDPENAGYWSVAARTNEALGQHAEGLTAWQKAYLYTKDESAKQAMKVDIYKAIKRTLDSQKQSRETGQ